MSPSANLLSGEVAERYVIEGEIGRGGTAVVYRARDRVRGTAVAIKLLREDAMSAVSVERFLLEIRQTAQLPHPHIVPVLDSGEHRGRPYFVLPFLEGGTLRDKLKKQKQLPFEEVIAIGVTVARALEYAHSRGVIHRDVKPENILFNDGQACLADFGTARALERAATDPTTSTGVVRGTAAYMSPEQASGEREYDGRTDIYSLACVLYECVAGIQPFVGPTMQAVISQRLSHTPRPVSVYRPTVSSELEQVLAKATALAPADRYQRAGDFAEALELAPKSTSSLRLTPASTRPWVLGSRRILGGALLGAVGIGAWLATSPAGRRMRSDTALDTTLVAIMPVDVAGASSGIAGQELLLEGLRNWSGVNAVETFATNDAIRRRSGSREITRAAAELSLEDLAAIARSLRAGRFIRARVTDRPGLHAVYAALYDVASGRDLHSVSTPLPPDSATWPDAYRRTVDSLMLRGARDNRAPRKEHRRSLPALQSFLGGRTALSNWDLPLADSLFTQTLTFDSTDSRAKLWLAQVKSWRDLPPQLWVSTATNVARMGTDLAPSERLQARALALLAAGDYEGACAAYRDIVESNRSSFIGWYGLGDCRRLDRLVVPDSTSPSHWRFRSSYWQAIQAYSTAFRLLPSAYKGVQARSYRQLRQFLLTSGQLRPGAAAGNPANSFLSRPAASGDSIMFVPYPREAVSQGVSLADKQAQADAVARTRRIFQDIIIAWRSAFPNSASVREAFAVSLEILGDPSAAADSFRTARSGLSPDSSLWLRLGVEESVARVKAAVASDLSGIPRAVRLMDSVIARAIVRDTADAELMSRIASLRGRCAETEALARQVRTFTEVREIPPSAAEAVRVAVAQSAARCENPVRLPEVSATLRRAGLSDSASQVREYELLGAVVAVRFPRDTAMIIRLSQTSHDYILRAEAALLKADQAEAKRIVGPVLASRVANPVVASLDAVVLEARLAMAFGDSATALKVVERALSVIQFAPPLSEGEFTVNQLRLGAITEAIWLRATLDPDADNRRRWMTALSQLLFRPQPSVSTR